MFLRTEICEDLCVHCIEEELLGGRVCPLCVSSLAKKACLLIGCPVLDKVYSGPLNLCHYCGVETPDLKLTYEVGSDLCGFCI